MLCQEKIQTLVKEGIRSGLVLLQMLVYYVERLTPVGKNEQLRFQCEFLSTLLSTWFTFTCKTILHTVIERQKGLLTQRTQTCL